MERILINMTLSIYQGDNLEILKTFTSESFQLLYIDPPFGTNKTQKIHENFYEDTFDSYLDFIVPRLEEAHRLLTLNGSIFIHLDYRWVHYVKVECDKIFGRDNFINEIVWCYDYGGRSKTRWSCKHDNILYYAKNANNRIFNFEAMDRIPYEAPGLCGEAKAKIGKTPTDWWKETIVHTTGKERVGYPTQKPLKILERIVKIHSNENDNLLDFFAGSGSFGEAACKNNRNCVLIDSNPQAIEVITKRLSQYNPII
jgi:site-specific DNA-methyltransferase (adenine-specific)